MEDNNTIIFRMGEETGIVIEKTKEQFEHSLFKEQYKQAFSIMDTIIERSTKTEEHPVVDDKMSNIIVFSGDRGTGKTSALESIRGILSNKSILKDAQSVGLFSSKSELDTDSFKVLRLVDPAFFDDKHNLMELLIGQMYADILQSDEEIANKRDSSYACMDFDVDKRTQLVRLFQKVRIGLSIVHKPSDKSAYDNLEEIDQLAAGSELRNTINDLLQCYAKYFKKKRVLICIDDIDLNTTEGYTMVEEIRKYLSLPTSCVVLMAMSIEQMIEVVMSYLRENLSSIITKEDIKGMAIRYVSKLLPTQNRIVMPAGQGIIDLPLIIEENGEKEPPYESVKEAVVLLIYRKTRYIFVNGRNLSPIVPTNLRYVRYLVRILHDMTDVTNTSGDDIIKNKAVFKHYLYNIWTKNLQDKDASFVRELVSNEDLVSINKSVILYLRERLLELVNDKKYKFEGMLATLIDPLNTMQNVSLGDVFYVLNYIDSVDVSEDAKNLGFFLRAFYSIQLYDAYNYVSETEAHLFVNDEDKKPSIYKYDEEMRHLNKLQRLINGSYFTYELGSFMPTERAIPREKRVIDGNALCLLLATVKDSKDVELQVRILRLCEFFVLTTCYPAYYKQGVEYNKKSSRRSYYTSFSPSNNYIVFDVLSIFYNLVNVKFTYQRWNDIFGGDFFEFALSHKDSLLNRIIESCESNHPTPQSDLDNRWHSLISDSTIRFSEVQLAILDNLCNRRDVRKEGGNAHNVRVVYSAIQNIGIKLYPLEVGDDRYELKFYALNPIIDFLKDVNVSVFDKIYSFVDDKKEDINNIDKDLDNIFANSFAKKNVKYPKNGSQVLKKLITADVKLYNADKAFWEELFDNNNEYTSWENLREYLSQYIEEIREINDKATRKIGL